MHEGVDPSQKLRDSTIATAKVLVAVFGDNASTYRVIAPALKIIMIFFQ